MQVTTRGDEVRVLSTGRRSNRWLLACASLAIGATALSLPASAQGEAADPEPLAELDPANRVDLQLLAFNDYHGHVEGTASGSVGGIRVGGGQYLAAKFAELRAGNANTLTVAAGDLIGASPALSGLFRDEPSVESLNAMGLDYSSVGNHEFDDGVAELLRMQNGGCHPVDGCFFPAEPYAGATFDWLAANTVNETTGDTVLPGYAIEEVDGVKVAFIGMTLEATPSLVAAAGIVGWDFLDEAATANALVPELQAQGVESIVVLLHEGGSQSPPPGEIDGCANISGPVVAINDALDPAIDVLVTGHTHLPYNCSLPDSAGQPRIVTSAFAFGAVVSEIDLVLDRATGDVHRDLSTARNHLVVQSTLSPDAAVTAVINKWKPLVDALANTVIGRITADIPRGGVGGSDRGVESPAGNLVADAHLWKSSVGGSQIALMNPGGLRTDLLFASSGAGEGNGVVTYGEAFAFQPFGNTLVTMPMTGDQIVSVLEEQCQPLGSSRPFLHLGVSGGFTYDLFKRIDAGNCVEVSVTNVRLNGVPLDLGATYRVTVNNFLADGGDNFITFGTIDRSLRFIGGNDLEALVEYFGEFSPLTPPPTDRVNELSAPVACQPGFFSTTGTEPCTPAPAGSFVATSGAVEATPCPAGTFSASAGAVACTPAPVGSFVDTPGAVEATPCPAGETTAGVGSVSEDDCFPTDTDGDGVADVDDVCPATVLPDAPTRQLTKNRFAASLDGFASVDGVVVASLADTGGCSGTQIIAEAGLGSGHTRFGISRSALHAWIDTVNA